MPNPNPTFRSSFRSLRDENTGLGKRPVVFDILAPDFETSLLPDNLKMVLHVNPSSMRFKYGKVVERIQTKGGHVEQHYGQGAESISFEFATGAFMRLYTGLISITGGPHSMNVGGTRRDTIAYDFYLDLLSLFKHNGSIYDYRGNIVFQGILKVSFDGDYWLGWFESFSVSEEAESPYKFTMSGEFTVAREFMVLRTLLSQTPDSGGAANPLSEEFDQQAEDEQARQEAQQRSDALQGRDSTDLGAEPVPGATPGWNIA